MTTLASAFVAPIETTRAALAAYWRLFAGQQRRLVAAAVVYLIKHSPAVLLPVITGYTVDLLAQKAAPERIALCALGTVLLISLNLPGHRLYVRWVSQAVRSMEAALRSALAQRLQVLAMPWWWRQSPAALQTKLLRDVEALGQLTIALADGVLGCGSGIAVALAVTAWRTPQFLWLFIVTVPMATALVWSTRARMTEAQRDYRQAVESLGDSAAEMARLLPLTRAHGLEHAQLERVGARINDTARTGLALDLAGGRFGALAWAGFQGLNALCLFVAAAVYVSGVLPMTLGDVVLLSGFFATLTNSVLGLVGLVPQIHRGIEAIRSIDELLRTAPVELTGSQQPTALQGTLSFECVSYQHESSSGVGVLDITLKIPHGQMVALVGPSGSGKTTLAMLACGLLRPSRGQIMVDGLALQTIEPRTWRRHVSWVPQDALLGDGTVRDNLVFGLGEVAPGRIDQVLRDTGCASFVARLPQGLDTPLGHHGNRLSGGERQRLALARALLREPRLLVLDEPTSALDGDSERIVLATLARTRSSRTTLVIAHRLSTVVDADCIVVMEAGRIVDQGTHGELFARCALYRRLWQPPESVN
jgi:ATP-binding cassette subfamily B protein